MLNKNIEIENNHDLNALLILLTLNPVERAYQSARKVLATANKRGPEARKRALSRLNKARALRNRFYSGKPRTKRYSADFEITLAGIPVGVAILGVECETVGDAMHRPDLVHNEYEIDYVLLDRNGYEMGDWIRDKAGHLQTEHAVFKAASVKGFL